MPRGAALADTHTRGVQGTGGRWTTTDPPTHLQRQALLNVPQALHKGPKLHELHAQTQVQLAVVHPGQVVQEHVQHRGDSAGVLAAAHN